MSDALNALKKQVEELKGESQHVEVQAVDLKSAERELELNALSKRIEAICPFLRLSSGRPMSGAGTLFA